RALVCDCSPNSVSPHPPMALAHCASCRILPVTYAMMSVETYRGQAPGREGDGMDFVAVPDQVTALLRQRGRVAYRTLKRQFQLDDEALEDLKIELIDSQRVAIDEQGTVLVWTGEP